MSVQKDERLSSLIERAKSRAGLRSDAQLAQRLHVTRAAVSAWQVGRSTPDAQQLLSLCQLSGDDPAQQLCEIEIARAQSVQVRTFWEGLLQRINAANSATVFALFFAAVALSPADSYAAWTPQSERVDLLRIVFIQLGFTGIACVLSTDGIESVQTMRALRDGE